MKFYHKLKQSFSLESKFTTAYLKEFKKDWWCFKIPDIGRTIKPFDWFGINKDWVIFCEAKVIDSNIVNFNIFRDNQLTSLEKIYLITKKYNFPNVSPLLQIYSTKYNDYRFIHINDLLEAENRWETKIILNFSDE